MRPDDPLLADLRLPVLCAPMTFVSSLELTIACCRAGVIGGWQGQRMRSTDEFERYLTALAVAEGQARDAGERFAPPAVNLSAHAATDGGIGEAKLALCASAAIPLVISSVGDPRAIAERAHDWGGRVIHDVTTLRHAEKAIAAGVDGLMLTGAGAGGLAGKLTPFAFVPAVRAMFDGLVLAGGGIATGAGIHGAIALGADIAVLGTRFIATDESAAPTGHKQMITTAGMEDIVVSDAYGGVDASWMRPSLPRGDADGARLRAWQDIWSAGHSVGLIDEVLPVQRVVDRLAAEFAFARARPTTSW